MGSPITRRVLSAAVATLILGGTAVISTAAPASAADNDGELLMALDASGSMEESDGAGSTKMETARDAVIDVATAMPAEAKVGFRAYGPASTGSGCKASKLLNPVETIDREGITTSANKLKPEGDTPIAYSLEQAAKDFGDTGGPKTILLVSDGEESCDGDPVATAEKLTKQGVDLRVHVIGFQVDDKARKQLTKIAKAGKGSYYDAQDGPALASRLKRASEHALRPYQTAGKPIDGSTNGLNAPELKPGQYLDIMPPNAKGEEPAKYYSFELPEKTDAYVAATIPWATVLEAETTENSLRVQVSTETDSGCEYETDHNSQQGGGSAAASVTATVRFDAKAEKGKCGAAGKYTVQVDNNGQDDRNGEAPLELTMVKEASVKNADSLPETYAAKSEPDTKAKVEGKASKVTGSGGIGDATIVEDGVYNDVLRPGEEVFYRVPLDWGQRLAYQIDLPKLDAKTKKQLGTGTGVDTTVLNPVRKEAAVPGSGNNAYVSGDPVSASGFTAPVRYNNRDTDDTEIANAALSGYYYIMVRMDASVDDPYFELPITLKADVQGKADGEPKYDDTNDLGTPAEQLDVELLSSDGSKDKTLTGGSSTMLWIGIAVGAVLVLGGGGTAWMMLRRRPTA